MKCIKCGKAGVKYFIPRKREGNPPNRCYVKRTDFRVKCSKCNWEGIQ